MFRIAAFPPSSSLGGKCREMECVDTVCQDTPGVEDDETRDGV